MSSYVRIALLVLRGTTAAGWATIGTVLLSIIGLYALTNERSKTNAPVVGSSLLGGYWTAARATLGLKHYLEEGYPKYKNGAFQVPAVRAWVTYVQGDLLTDVRKAKDDTLSFDEEMNHAAELSYTLGNAMRFGRKAWHIEVLRKQLTPSLAGIFPDVLEEVRFAYEKELKLPEDGEWKELVAYEAILRSVCRTVTRMFVGTSLCRNEGYLEISREFATTVIKAGFMISAFPNMMKSWVSEWLSPAPDAIAKFLPYTEALVRVREQLKEKYGEEEWEVRKPNDLLQWFLDAPGGPGPDPNALNITLLGMNFAAIHSSSMTMTHTFYYLAAHPEYATELREEVDERTKEHGWTRESLDQMHKIDSFVKESMRLTPILVSSVGRRAMKSITLSDGTSLPKGAHIYANLWGTQHDPALWSDPETFDPWRFSRASAAGEGGAKNLFTTPTPEFLFWGYGEHICPGRFFAAQSIKLMLAHIVTSYDVKLRDGEGRPANTFFSNACVPDQKAKVLFRRRVKA
ncbi:cytochrome P450 [Calocera viscosa TUFC12733]|uniref:Cytochrome P450 n=1 Tax=Calocera viscosa (strain TUFC12733) TaxID=1330018 RepID=A0A167K9X0_CALVF|nr:cytochrome P450 [Calocera viscosa TUFC12733]